MRMNIFRRAARRIRLRPSKPTRNQFAVPGTRTRRAHGADHVLQAAHQIAINFRAPFHVAVSEPDLRIAVDNAAIEARPDVLTYTSTPFLAGQDLVGPVSARIFVRTGRQHAGVFLLRQSFRDHGPRDGRRFAFANFGHAGTRD